MNNYQLTINKYFSTWWTVILRPIYFFTKLKEESWRAEALTFLMQTSWLLALLATIVIFVVQYIPIGGTLLQIVHGAQIIIVLPVLITLAAVFFMITFLILGGLLTVGFFSAFYALAVVLHYVYKTLGGVGRLDRQIQSLFYCGSVLLSGTIILALMILTKYGNFSFTLFRFGFDTIYFFTVLYLYGLIAVAGKKNYRISKTKAFLGAMIPLVALLIFGFLFDKMLLPRLQQWIS